jgi:hypothetical protein
MLMLFQTFLYPGDDFEQMFNLADLVFRNQVRNVSKSNEIPKTLLQLSDA